MVVIYLLRLSPTCPFKVTLPPTLPKAVSLPTRVIGKGLIISSVGSARLVLVASPRCDDPMPYPVRSSFRPISMVEGCLKPGQKSGSKDRGKKQGGGVDGFSKCTPTLLVPSISRFLFPSNKG